MDQANFNNLLTLAVQHGASDIHLQPGVPPAFRMKGDLVNVKSAPVSDTDMLMICRSMVAEKSVLEQIDGVKDYDGSFEIKGVARFRFNIFRSAGKLGAILRVIPAVIPTIDKLGLPKVLKTIAGFSRGLVLVTGATGSGKSSTLAAMIDFINSTQPSHILTIEDPVEFVHSPKKSRLTQREIGRDTINFAHALRAGLRQDPDVILVGEMRDAETIDIALKAAETGHLVFSTVHTNDAIKTIGRLIAVFPPEEQRIVRMRLADNLMASVSQRLVKRADGKGVVAVQEIMVSNATIAECISDPAMTGQMNDFIAKSGELNGGQTFEQHLVKLYQEQVITLQVAKEASTNPSDFERNLMYGAGAGGKKSQDSPRAIEETVILAGEHDTDKTAA